MAGSTRFKGLFPFIALTELRLNQYESHVVAGTLKIHKYHGTGKNIALEALVNFDVVLTTYATLGSDVSRDYSALNQFEWFRIVLDEGMQLLRHVIIALRDPKLTLI